MRSLGLGLLLAACGLACTSGPPEDSGSSSSSSSSGATGSGASSSGAVVSSSSAPPASSGVSTGGSSATGTSSSAAGSSSAVSQPASGATSSAPSSGTNASSAGTSSSSGAPAAGDPNLDGPHAVTTAAATFMAASSGRDVTVTCHRPATAGPYPTVLVLPGFSLPVSQFVGYAQRLASHGFLACLVAYNPQLFPASQLAPALEVEDALDFLVARTDPAVDPARIGIVGHSLGGKLAFYVATQDARVAAVLGLDPVDAAAPLCSAANCPEVSDTLTSLQRPTGFLGETLDATAASAFGQACAPAADNFTTFYASANSPSFMVTIQGANHMSFLDDVASCGFTCSACKAPTLDNATVNGMARAYTAAFFRRHLLADPSYDAYLTGAQAQARYVTSGLATIASK